MAEWPRDYGLHPFLDQRVKASGISIPERGLGTIDITGSRIGAAILVNKDGKLSWSFAKEATKGHPMLQTIQDRIETFPPTAPPKLARRKMSTKRLAEQGTDFLRTAYPDLDIPADVIEAEYENLDTFQKAHDPSSGNLLGHLAASDVEGITTTDFLAFPMGEIGAQLNFSPLFKTADDMTVFYPSANIVTAFDTPIKQIEALPKHSSFSGPSSLIVRTYGKTTYFRVLSTSLYTEDPRQFRPKVVPLAVLDSCSTSGHPIMDISLNEQGSQALFVNSRGQVYRSRFRENGALDCVEFKKSEESKIDSEFWRARWTRGHMHGLLASERTLSTIDLRTSEIVSQWSPLPTEGSIVSIEGASERALPCVSTNACIFWFDERNFKVPVFVQRHYRLHDRTLRTLTKGFGKNPITLLSSANNSLISVYDVSRNDSDPELIHCWSNPFALPILRNVFTPFHRRVGLQVTPKPGEPESFCLFELSDRGTLYMSEFAPDSNGMNIDCSVPVFVEFNVGVRVPNQSIKTSKGEDGPSEQPSPFVEHASNIYRDFFGKCDSQECVPNSSMEDTYELLERMENFARWSQAPLENVLTLGEIAALCGDDPITNKRSGLFSRNPLDTKQGRYAIFKGRLPIEEIAKSVSWESKIVETLSVLHKDFPPDLDNAVGLIENFNTKLDENSDVIISQVALRQQTEATELIALDMILASRVFAPPDFQVDSSKNITNSSESGDTSGLEGATAALSLKPSSPPAFHFHHLRPIKKSLNDSDDEYQDPVGDNSASVVPAGVRYLLDEWKLGRDPKDYVYIDPFAAEDPADTEISKFDKKGKARESNKRDVFQSSPPFSQLPPTIVPKSKAPPAITSTSQHAVRHNVRFSSPVFNTQPNAYLATQTAFQQSSQESATAFPNSQQVPGRFGGRMTMGKKPVKKRMGGF